MWGPRPDTTLHAQSLLRSARPTHSDSALLKRLASSTPPVPTRAHVVRTSPALRGGGDTEARQQKARMEMQHLIYFWNILMKHLQYMFKNNWNTYNINLKHL
jgi:hypothetical protein